MALVVVVDSPLILINHVVPLAYTRNIATCILYFYTFLPLMAELAIRVIRKSCVRFTAFITRCVVANFRLCGGHLLSFYCI